MRLLEGQLMAGGYQGSPLTMFTGIPFGRAHPYSETEAKVILKGLMAALRPKLAAARDLMVDTGVVRPAIGGGWDHVWDIVGFTFAHGADTFTEAPHLTVGVGRREASLQLTVPHNARQLYWDPLQLAGTDVLRNRLLAVTDRLRPTRHRVGGAWEPQLSVQLYQRHFYAQRRPRLDGEVRFEVDTLFPTQGKLNPRVKTVPSWLEVFVRMLSQARKANFEFALRAEFPLQDGSIARTPRLVDALVVVARAFQPFVSMIAATPPFGKPRAQLGMAKASSYTPPA